MMTILSIRSLHTIKFTAKQFVSYLKNNPEKVYCFNGKMGAGKTTFIKASKTPNVIPKTATFLFNAITPKSRIVKYFLIVSSSL